MLGLCSKSPLPSRCEDHKQSGFTLIELMVVVGIIGILVSISGPTYERYQAKARQSEAKIALSAIYGLEKAFYSEYSAYVAGMDAIGYSSEGQRRFYFVGWYASSNAGVITGFSGSIGPSLTSPAGMPASWNTCNPNTEPGAVGVTPTPAATDTNPQSFLAIAVGQVRYNTHCDIWSISDLKILSNKQAGI